MKQSVLITTILGLVASASIASAAPDFQIKPITEVPGASMIKPNGGWCWYQGPRAIVIRDGRVVFTTISGDTYSGLDAGDLWLTAWDPKSETTQHFELHNKFQRDDHDVAALLERKDGSILAAYSKHGNDKLLRWRISGPKGDVTQWSDEETFNVSSSCTYTNVFQLSDENNRIYNFQRSIRRNPNCTISDDNGKTWQSGWGLLHWRPEDYKKLPKHTGNDGSRPYLRYASNNKDTIHFVTTEDHPRAFDNSIYHGYYKGGKLHNSVGKVLSEPASKDAKRLTPLSFTCVFEGDIDNVAWTADLEIDKDGNPYTAFSIQTDGAKARGKRRTTEDNHHRYGYARFDGEKWHTYDIAYAGTQLYNTENDYTGLITLDPDDPNTVVISTNSHPVSGEPLISNRDNKRHWELYKGQTADGGKTWKWSAITSNSTVDNLRPNIPINPGGDRIILWGRGDLKSFKDYRLDMCILHEAR